MVISEMSHLSKTNRTQELFDRNAVVKFGGYTESVFVKKGEAVEDAIKRRFGVAFVAPEGMTVEVYRLR